MAGKYVLFEATIKITGIIRKPKDMIDCTRIIDCIAQNTVVNSVDHEKLDVQVDTSDICALKFVQRED